MSIAREMVGRQVLQKRKTNARSRLSKLMCHSNRVTMHNLVSTTILMKIDEVLLRPNSQRVALANHTQLILAGWHCFGTIDGET